MLKKIQKISYSYWVINRQGLYISLLIILIGIFLLPNTAYLSSITPNKLIELTNKERIEKDLSELISNPLLIEAAKNKADAIMEAQIFAHNIDDKKFSSWIQDVGYEYSYIGENLAIDFKTSEGIMDAWINSEFHKKNILNPRFSEIGIAVIDGVFEEEDTTLIVQIFGEPAGETLQNKISSIDLEQNIIENKIIEEKNIKVNNLVDNNLIAPPKKNLIDNNPIYTTAKDNEEIKLNFFQNDSLIYADTFNLSQLSIISGEANYYPPLSSILIKKSITNGLNKLPKFSGPINVFIMFIAAVFALLISFIGTFSFLFFSRLIHQAHVKK